MNKSQIELQFLYRAEGKQTNKTNPTTTTKPKQTKQQRKETSVLLLSNLVNVVLMMYIGSVLEREQNSIIPQANGLVCRFTDLSIHNAGESRENGIIIK